jgi:hypothetical protein
MLWTKTSYYKYHKKKLKVDYPKITPIITFIPETNGINLYVRVKDFLRNDKNSLK